MAQSSYDKGQRAERRVAAQLRRAGASVGTSRGSRGPADLEARFANKKWLVQVKSGKNPPTDLHGRDKQRLNQAASRQRATPVLARVGEDGVEYRSTRSGRKLKP